MTPETFAMLVCPLTRTKLRYDEAQQELVSDAAQLAFPICDGVPILVVDEARHFSAAQRDR